jgi:hypothetical protein
LIFDNVVFSACELNTHFYTSNIKIIK